MKPLRTKHFGTIDRLGLRIEMYDKYLLFSSQYKCLQFDKVMPGVQQQNYLVVDFNFV